MMTEGSNDWKHGTWDMERDVTTDGNSFGLGKDLNNTKHENNDMMNVLVLG